ncbi:MAG TPA: hypothetical protein VMU50_01910, partial [Polyangia bacterium]|nr:hypothetical protein [Polyangia bacterium]
MAVLTACANRGMTVNMGTGGASGDGSGGAGGGGDGTGGSGSGGSGSGGAIGTGGAPVVDSSADATDARDASADHSCSATAATFNFESGVQ